MAIEKLADNQFVGIYSSFALIISASSFAALTTLDSHRQVLASNICPAPEIVSEIDEATKATTVSKENYAYAETDIILSEYVKKIAKSICSTGVGEFMHIRDAIDLSLIHI